MYFESIRQQELGEISKARFLDHLLGRHRFLDFRYSAGFGALLVLLATHFEASLLLFGSDFGISSLLFRTVSRVPLDRGARRFTYGCVLMYLPAGWKWGGGSEPEVNTEEC